MKVWFYQKGKLPELYDMDKYRSSLDKDVRWIIKDDEYIHLSDGDINVLFQYGCVWTDNKLYRLVLNNITREIIDIHLDCNGRVKKPMTWMFGGKFSVERGG